MTDCTQCGRIQTHGAHRRCRDRECAAVRKEERPMKYLNKSGVLACILSFGQALIPAVSAQAATHAAASNPIVSISTGQLRGSLTSDGVAVFKNIPFAQPPIGELRWRTPLPAK